MARLHISSAHVDKIPDADSYFKKVMMLNKTPIMPRGFIVRDVS